MGWRGRSAPASWPKTRVAVDEFGLIGRYFAPLSAGYPGALDLSDDAALIDAPEGEQIVATVDALVAGVHFVGDEIPADVATKALRVNLSDLAAMGARPIGYLLALALPTGWDEAWVAGFADGLRGDQDRYGIVMLGGDTVSTPGPLTVSVTALGSVPRGRALRRSSAAADDLIFVSGTLGDAGEGLRVLRAGEGGEDAAFLADRYRHPQPRLALGRALLGVASAALDVSDGLMGDLDHICTTSKLAARIEASSIPLSQPLRRRAGEATIENVLTDGDDYEILFTAPAARLAAVEAAARSASVPVTRIGQMVAGQGISVLDADGRPLSLSKGGFRHF
ncbi:MAG: thiamine-phosphate kinase [Rhodospirillaceae bacterium]|nr:thiamine-phosphate kinase [Rhodospirillaceae bacterium]